MRMMVCGTLLVSLLAWVPVAQAQDLSEESFKVATTGDLVALCGAQETHALYTAAQNFCHGFAVGTYRTLVAVQSGLRSRRKLFCPPNDGISRNDAIAAFKQWANKNPDVLAMPATDGVFKFLTVTYPCK